MHMKKVRITVLKTTLDEELARQYGVPGLTACPMLRAGQVFYADYAKPEGLCDEAWKAIYQYAFALAHGAGDGPVSYTHLDVYKRQVSRSSTPLRWCCKASNALRGRTQARPSPFHAASPSPRAMAAVSAQTPAPTSVGSSAPTSVHLALRVSRAMVRSVVEHGQ